MKKKINVGLVFGGKSEEYEVSLMSAASVYEAIDKDKYNCDNWRITPADFSGKGYDQHILLSATFGIIKPNKGAFANLSD